MIFRSPTYHRLILSGGLFFSLAVAGNLFSACTQPAPVSLNSEDRAMVDTLYSRQVQELRPRLDSLCEAIFDEEVERAVDSMLVIRRAEKDKLRQRPPGDIEL